MVELWSGVSLDGLGVTFALISAVIFAAYLLLAEREVAHRDSISLMAWGFFFATRLLDDRAAVVELPGAPRRADRLARGPPRGLAPAGLGARALGDRARVDRPVHALRRRPAAPQRDAGRDRGDARAGGRDDRRLGLARASPSRRSSWPAPPSSRRDSPGADGPLSRSTFVREKRSLCAFRSRFRRLPRGSCGMAALRRIPPNGGLTMSESVAKLVRLLRKNHIFALFAVIFALFAAPAALAAKRSSSSELNLLAAVNATRAAYGLRPLHLDSTLERAARCALDRHAAARLLRPRRLRRPHGRLPRPAATPPARTSPGAPAPTGGPARSSGSGSRARSTARTSFAPATPHRHRPRARQLPRHRRRDRRDRGLRRAVARKAVLRCSSRSPSASGAPRASRRAARRARHARSARAARARAARAPAD